MKPMRYGSINKQQGVGYGGCVQVRYFSLHGGGDTPQTPTPSAGGVSSSSGYYTVAESRNGGSAPSTLSVVDPADPAHPKLTVTVDGQGDLYYQTTQTSVTDSVAHTARVTGTPMLVYVKTGALYQVDLLAGGSATPVRISSESHVCQIYDIHDIAGTGYDAWIQVTTAGADGNCATTGDNRQVLVRSNSSVATSGTAFPETSSIVGNYGTSSTPMIGFIVREGTGSTSKMRLYSANMTPGNIVTGSEGANYVENLAGTFTPGAPIYFIVDQQLKVFTTNGTTASLSSSLYTFTNTNFRHSTADGTTVYFVDDVKIMRIAGSSVTQLSTLPLGGNNDRLLQTSTHLIISQANAISAVPKVGGTATVLKTGSNLLAHSASGSQVTYLSTPNSNGSRDIRTVNVNGSNDTLLESNVFPFGPVLNSVYALDGSMPVLFKSLVYCAPRIGDTDCRNGKLKSMDMTTHATTILGEFHSSSSLMFFNIGQTYGFDGVAMPILVTGVISGSVRWSDAYVVTPGVANSLARVTNLVP